MQVEEKEQPQCPFCDSRDAVLLSPFGTAQLVRQFYCNSCSSVFEYIRWQGTGEAGEEG